MTAGLVSSQFIIYGYCKTLLGAPGGVEIHKDDSPAPPSSGGH